MRIVSTLQNPTSVSHSLRCKLLSGDDSVFLVVARVSVIEVYILSPQGLLLQCSVNIWGRVVDVKAVHFESRDYLLVLIDHPNPTLCLLRYSSASNNPKIASIASLPIRESQARPTELFTGLLVTRYQGDNIAVASTYVGRLKFVKVREDGFDPNYEIDLSIPEHDIHSMCFLPQRIHAESLLLALLHRNPRSLEKVMLRLYAVISPSRSPKLTFLSEVMACDESGTECTYYIAAMSNTSGRHPCSVIVLGGKEILQYGITSNNKRPLFTLDEKPTSLVWPFSNVSAFTHIEEDDPRFIIGDDFGRLALFMSKPNSPPELFCLGEASSPTSITHLSSQYFFLGSHYGDSLVLQLEATYTPSGQTHITAADKITNIAPIADAVITGLDSNGRAQFVTCSGGNNTGSLNLIRHGAYYMEGAKYTNVLNTRAMWPLKGTYADSYHSYLMVSTPLSSRILELPRNEGATMTVLETDGLSHKSTIVAANLVNRSISAAGKSVYDTLSTNVAQVTASGVYLLDVRLRTLQDSWEPDTADVSIVAADISPSQICLALSNGKVELLCVKEGKLEYLRGSYVDNADSSEISCLSFLPPDQAKQSQNYSSRYVLLGLWDTNTVLCFSTTNLEQRGCCAMSSPPTSLLTQRRDGYPCVYVGQADGTVSMCSISNGELTLLASVVIGGSPLSMCVHKVNGADVIVAVGDQAAILQMRNDQLSHTPILIKGGLAPASLRQKHYKEDTLAFAFHDSLTLGRMPQLNKIHIRKIPTGLDNPCKIAFDFDTSMLGVGFITRSPCVVGQNETITGKFKLMDGKNMEVISEYRLNASEVPTALALVKVKYEESLSTFFALGTSTHHGDGAESITGRVILFTTREDQPLSLPGAVTCETVPGSVYAIACVQGYLIANVNSSVYLFSLEVTANGETALRKSSELCTNYIATSLAVRDSMVLVGDAMYSVTLLRVTDGVLRSIARNYTPLWPLSVAFDDEANAIVSNCDGNLYSLGLQPARNLEIKGAFRFDEIVNKFTNNDDVDTSRPCITNYAFTSTGRISLFVKVNEEKSLLLSKLQRNMANFAQGIGLPDHNVWRSPTVPQGRDELSAFGFLDGDFIEGFHSLTAQEQNSVLDGSHEYERLHEDETQISISLKQLQHLH